MILEIYDELSFIEEALKLDPPEVRMASVTWTQPRGEVPFTYLELRLTILIPGGIVRFKAGTLSEMALYESGLADKKEKILKLSEEITKRLEEKGLKVHPGEWTI